MAGISEVLILVLIIICILILPRFFKTDSIKTVQLRKKRKPLSPVIRIFIILSILLPVVTAVVVKPWDHNFHIFILIGVIPVLLLWSVYWIMEGFKKR